MDVKDSLWHSNILDTVFTQVKDTFGPSSLSKERYTNLDRFDLEIEDASVSDKKTLTASYFIQSKVQRRL